MKYCKQLESLLSPQCLPFHHSGFNNNLYVGSTSYEKHRRLGPKIILSIILKTDFRYYTFVYISSNQATLY